MTNQIRKIVSKCRRGFHFLTSTVELRGADVLSPFSLVRAYESACLAVYDGMCMQDRLATAFALERYLGAAAAIENHSEPARSELRGLIGDRDVVPPSVDVAVQGLVADIRSIPEPVLASAMRVRHGNAADHPDSIRRIECALTLMEMAATRRPKTQTERRPAAGSQAAA